MKYTLSIYDADKTGMVDYALESAGKIKKFVVSFRLSIFFTINLIKTFLFLGGTVLGTRCTQTKSSTAALTMFGIPLWFISNGPRLAIQVVKFL